MNKIVAYIQAAYNEMMHKVSWPTHKELYAHAWAVLVASLLFALLIGGVDAAFKNIMQFVYQSV